jgi:hypothetical protein
MTPHELSSKLIHAVIQHDIRQNKRKGYNHNALAQYMMRVDEVVAEVERGKDIGRALRHAFNDRLLTVCLKAVGLPCE